MNDSLALDEWTTNQQLQTDHFTLPQWHHYNKMRDILNKYPVASDHSSTGSGKTRVSLTLARSLNLIIFLISPKGLGLTWLTESRTIGFTKCLWNDECYTYSKVRGKESGLTDPGMLKRGIDKDGQLFFQPTLEWENLVSEGVLLILDESQYASNDTQQNMAVSALSHYIVSRWIADNNCKSRILMLSGTPFDKMKSVPGYFRALGLIKYNEFVWKTNKQYSWVRPSRSNLVQILHKTDSNGKTCIKDIKNNLSGRQKLNQSLFDVWTIHLSQHFKSEMIKPDTGFRLISNKDGQWFSLDTLTPNYRTKLKEEMKRLVDALESNDMKTSKTIWIGIDSIKTTIVVKQIDQIIQNGFAMSEHTSLIRPKILIYCTFIDTMRTLHQTLSKDYRCQILSGNQSAYARQNLVQRFNSRDSDNGSIQILIVSIRLGNAGWNMQDLLGTEPRHVFIFPSFFVREMYQAEGRAYRLGMKSDVTINYVHVEENRELENKIKSKMQDSSNILRTLCNVQAASQTESYLMQNDGVELRSSSSRVKASTRNPSKSIAPSSHPLIDVQSRLRPKKSSPFIDRNRTRSKPIPTSPVSPMCRRVPLKRKFASPLSNFKAPSRRKFVSPPPFSWDYEDEDSEMDGDDETLFLGAQSMTVTDLNELRIKLEFESENEKENENEHEHEHESKSDKVKQTPASNKRLSLRNISNFSMDSLDHTHQQLVQTLMHSMSDQFEALHRITDQFEALQRVLQKPGQNSAI